MEWPFPIVLGAFDAQLCPSQAEKGHSNGHISTVFDFNCCNRQHHAAHAQPKYRDSLIILLEQAGHEPIYFFGSEKWVLPMYFLSEIWQYTGFGAIVYYAALSSIDEQLIEAATIDGCTKIKRIWHIELPCIMPTVVTMLILRLGKIFQMGPEKLLLMQTPLNMESSEVIATYIYKMGIVEGQLGFSTAIGLLNNVINFTILIIVNAISKKYTDTSIF